MIPVSILIRQYKSRKATEVKVGIKVCLIIIPFRKMNAVTKCIKIVRTLTCIRLHRATHCSDNNFKILYPDMLSQLPISRWHISTQSIH